MKFQNEFDQRFGNLINKRIALYGTGNNARLILDSVKGYDIVCLVSKDRTGEIVQGVPVMAIEEAIGIAETIIIAATPSSTHIILSRIAEVVPKDIPILDMFGNVLERDNSIARDSYWDKSYEQLITRIDKADVVSFDVFDTLIMRRTLRPDDIFKLAAEGCRIAADKGCEWNAVRKKAEEEVRKDGEDPKLEEIYGVIEEYFSIDDNSVKDLCEEEIRLEHNLILPRHRMKDVYSYAVKNEKQIIYTSDMYLDSNVIRGLLSDNGYNDSYPIYVSSEYGVTKKNGWLFQVLKDSYEGKNILHIGDDESIDGRMSEKQGISSFCIRSSYDLMASSSFSSVFDSIGSDSDRFYLGYLCSELLNNPFSLSDSVGKPQLSSYRDIALIIYPITRMYLDYIEKKSSAYDCIIFPSRDGFFLHNLYERDREHRQLPESIYLYASRMALSGIAASSEESTENDRINYKKYLFGLGMDEYRRTAIVDIVARGTQGWALSKILNKSIDMIMLGTTDYPNKYTEEAGEVFSVYGAVNAKEDGVQYSLSDLSVLHLFLEMLYASSDGQFVRIIDDGRPEFLDGSEYDADLLRNVQYEMTAIEDELEKLRFPTDSFTKEFPLKVLSALQNKYSVIAEGLKSRFAFSDPYDEKKKVFNLSDLL